MAKIKFNLNISNIGPHENLNFSDEISGFNMAIFGNNGQGKSFISKCLQLINPKYIDFLPPSAYIKFGASQGTFQFILDRNTNQEIQILVEPEKISTIKNSTTYIYHVFNSLYVELNLNAYHFRPNGDIKGYIVGIENIDVSHQKQKLQELVELRDKIELELKEKIKSGWNELVDLGIKSNMIEFRDFTYERLLTTNFEYPSTQEYSVLLNQFDLLKSIPQDAPDIPENIFNIDLDFLEHLNKSLGLKHNRIILNSSETLSYNRKRQLIELGIIELGLTETKDHCPFCEQIFDEKALGIISRYTEYLENEESKTIRQLEQIKVSLSTIKHNFHKSLSMLSQNLILLVELQKLIPSETSSRQTIYKNSNIIDNLIDSIVNLIDNKIKDISIPQINSAELLIQFKYLISEYCQYLSNFNESVKRVNEKKNNFDKERLALFREITKTKYNLVKLSIKSEVSTYHQYETEIKNTTLEIATLEEKQRYSKRKKVAEQFEIFLNRVFGDKYTFDRENFCLIHSNEHLLENAKHVLSDGEKSLIAFCYYLSEVHAIIELETDYDKLFFIIDDPISSLDFHYVYSVAQIIRNLKSIYPISEQGHQRFIILTHNLEFLSILTRNKIVKNTYYLDSGHILPIANELLMPYEHHLRDVYNIAIGEKKPSHTTGNSIRHILETINRFNYPNMDLKKLCNEIEELEGIEYINTLINDTSHGGYRLEIAYSNETIQSGCRAVISFIERTLGGQLTKIVR